MKINLELDPRTVSHLLNYTKELYRHEHLRDVEDSQVRESECIYCLEFILEAKRRLKQHTKRERRKLFKSIYTKRGSLSKR